MTRFAVPQAPQFAAPIEVTFPLRDGDITVRSADMGMLAKAKALMLPALEDLVRNAPGLLDPARITAALASGSVAAQDIADLVVLLEEVDVAFALVAVLTKRKVEQIEALMPDEFAYLFAVVVQVNADFFGQALPLIKAVARGLRSAAGPGPAVTGPAATPAPGTTTLAAAATS